MLESGRRDKKLFNESWSLCLHLVINFPLACSKALESEGLSLTATMTGTASAGQDQ